MRNHEQLEQDLKEAKEKIVAQNREIRHLLGLNGMLTERLNRAQRREAEALTRDAKWTKRIKELDIKDPPS